MKRILPRWRTIGLLAAAITFMLVIVACGDEVTPTPTATTAAAAPAATTAPAATATATKAAAAAAGARATPTPTSAARLGASAGATPTPTPTLAVSKKPVEAILKVAMVPPGQQTTVHYRTFQSSGGLLRNVYDYLIGVDRFTGAYIPALATEWSVTNNAKDWNFKLRDDAVFHDGTPFQAKDVRGSWIIDNEVATQSQSAAIYSNKVGSADNIELVNDNEVTFHLVEPWLALDFYYSYEYTATMYNWDYWQEAGEEEYISKPVGTGPFTFVQLRANEFIEFERFDDHWGHKAEFEGVKIFFVPEDATRAAMLLTDEAYMADVPELLMSTLEQGGMSRAVSTLPGFSVFYITGGQYYPDTEHYDPNDPLAKLNVRAAINHAINREQLLNTYFPGRGFLQTTHGLRPWIDPYDENYFKPYEYDPDKSRQLLADEGYTPGSMPDIKILISLNMSGVPELPDISEAVGSMLQQVGINVSFQTAEYGATQKMLWAYDLHGTLMAMRYSATPPDLIWESGMEEGRWMIRLDRALQAKMLEWTVETDPAKKSELELFWGKHTYDEYAIVPLFWLQPFSAINPNVIADYTAHTLHMGPVRYLEFAVPVYE